MNSPEQLTDSPSTQELASPASSSQVEDALTETERNIINIEKKRFKYQGSKEQAIFQQLGLSPIAYYQQLNTMIDNPRIIAAEPALTRRLRARREALR